MEGQETISGPGILNKTGSFTLSCITNGVNSKLLVHTKEIGKRGTGVLVLSPTKKSYTGLYFY